MSIVIHALQEKYFSLLKQENYPNTPVVTREADQLEGRIRIELAYEGQQQELRAKQQTENPA